ncbi:MAG: GNAT family N-acetyltransferase [Rhodobacteraceae bacterium]|nr:GNAT family N-acetyltransferase [Paracoccaceae bacterium]
MTLDARPITRDTVPALIGLSVRADQRDLVSANVKTLAEAAYEPGAVVWGLWDRDLPVGLMAMVNPDGVRQHGPHVQTGAAYLWRLMIAADCQGRGYGAAALRLAFVAARGWGAKHLVTGVNDVPHGNLGFYLRHGFLSTGVVEEGDLLLVRDLAQ